MRFEAGGFLSQWSNIICTLAITGLSGAGAFLGWLLNHSYPQGILSAICLFAFIGSCLVSYFFDLPRYSELQEGGLLVSQGKRKTMIPYASVEKLLPMSPSKSVFEENRFVLLLNEGKSYKFSIQEKERFLDELSKRCPQLERKGTDYGLSLQRPLAF